MATYPEGIVTSSEMHITCYYASFDSLSCVTHRSLQRLCPEEVRGGHGALGIFRHRRHGELCARASYAPCQLDGVLISGSAGAGTQRSDPWA